MTVGHPPMSRAHANMLCEHGLSDGKLRDSVGIPLETSRLIRRRLWEMPTGIGRA